MSHPQNESTNIYSGYGAPAHVAGLGDSTPSGQGVNMGSGPIAGDPEKGVISNDMHNDGDSPMSFKSASSDPSGFQLPHGRSYSEFNSKSQLEAQPDHIVTKIETDTIIHDATKKIY